jgi:hypothetical protein
MLTYTNGYLNYISGIQIEGFSQLTSNLFQGEICTLNVSITSTRKNNITVSLETSGDNFDMQIINQIKIRNNTRTYALVNVSAKIDSDIGEQEFYLDIYNGSILLKSGSQTINIESAVEIKYILFNEYLIDLQAHKLSIIIINHRTETAETVKIRITGVYVEELSENIGPIQPLEEKSVLFYLLVYENTPLGKITFNVNLSRSGTGIFNRDYSVQVVDEIEVISIRSSTIVYHGQSPYVSITVYNYNITQQTLTIQSNGIIIETTTITYGQQVINVPIANDLWNPYDVSQKNYEITLIDSDENVLAETRVFVSLTLSVGTVFYFYIIPIIAAVAIIVTFRYKQLENEKRK